MIHIDKETLMAAHKSISTHLHCQLIQFPLAFLHCAIRTENIDGMFPAADI